LTLASRLGYEKRLIAVDCRQNIDTVVGYLAARLGGHATIMMAGNLSGNLKRRIVEAYRPHYLWRSPNIEENYELETLKDGLVTKINRQLALLLPTSGSTGSPKHVRLSEANLDANAQSIIEYLRIDKSDRPITSLPFHYSYGLSVLNSHIQAGATLCVTGLSVSQGEFWKFFRSNDCNSFAGVPYTYEMLKRLGFARIELPSLRYMTQAGGKMNKDLTLYFLALAEERGFQFYTMYGQTEATARISYLPYSHARSKIGSIGKPIPKGNWWLVKENNVRIEEPNQEGELVYSGPNVMLGYAESGEDLALGDCLKGVLKTGDLVYMDAEGYCYITGRLKRFIKIYGNRFSLDEIEENLSQAGVECRVGGVDNKLCVAVRNPNQIDTVQSLLRNTFDIHRATIEALVVKDFPVSPSGKTLYGELFKHISN
jgi:acyl-CoA synthetase (AMP-forming)/AMP-acid ligase II